MEFAMPFAHPVTARLWEPIQPVARRERHEDPLHEVLQQAGLGEVDGGGCQLSETGEVTFDAVVAEIEAASANVREAATRTSLEVFVRTGILASAFVAVCWLAGSAAAQQTSKPIDYETYCKLPDLETKRSAFGEATPATRADLVRTQLERWRDANRSRLTDVQLKVLADLIALITPEVYSDGPAAEEQRVKARRVSELQFQHFTREEVQAMQPHSPCIAKVK